MFVRSENLFLRPAWPEDRARLDRAGVPAMNDPLRAADLGPAMIVTMPQIGGQHIAGTAGLYVRGNSWCRRIWLAPAFRHLGLFAEVEEALGTLEPQLPGPPRPRRMTTTVLEAA